jgi:hypothetical protein
VKSSHNSPEKLAEKYLVLRKKANELANNKSIPFLESRRARNEITKQKQEIIQELASCGITNKKDVRNLIKAVETSKHEIAEEPKIKKVKTRNYFQGLTPWEWPKKPKIEQDPNSRIVNGTTIQRTEPIRVEPTIKQKPTIKSSRKIIPEASSKPHKPAKEIIKIIPRERSEAEQKEFARLQDLAENNPREYFKEKGYPKEEKPSKSPKIKETIAEVDPTHNRPLMKAFERLIIGNNSNKR